jgi:hypothetical protein
MWLQTSKAEADEVLLWLVNEGYALLHELETEYRSMPGSPVEIDERAEAARARRAISGWSQQVLVAVARVFPTPREAHLFRRTDGYDDDDGSTVFHIFYAEVVRLERLVQGLDEIRLKETSRYNDLAPVDRLYIEDIDSFQRVRSTNPGMVRSALTDGRVELKEEQVQAALEDILGISFHRIDWGGEINDLRGTVMINGARRSAAFLLKGNGCKARELTIAKCGKNGDQIVRLFNSPAELFVVQYVGFISDAVVSDISTKVAAKRAEGRSAWFCVIDGDDTARLLKAYGFPLPSVVPRSSNKSASRAKRSRTSKRRVRRA